MYNPGRMYLDAAGAGNPMYQIQKGHRVTTAGKRDKADLIPLETE
jgi:hypothetical protein